MSKRDFYFDNAKFILIVFVVFGHFLRSYISDNSVIFALYVTIYLFHMPGFILVSGYFAKSFHKKGYTKKITQKILLPFFIFQMIYSFFYFYLYENKEFHLNLLVPNWSLWFLLSLFCWNLLLLISVKWLKLKPAILIVLSFAAGIMIGCINGQLDVLSFARTFIFFPFFLIGYYLKREHFTFLADKTVRMVLLLSIPVVFYSAYTFSDFDQRWLLGSSSFAELDSSNVEGMMYRVGIYVVSFIMIAAFLSFVPKKKFFFTDWGRNTLYVYLLHGFVIKTFRESEVKESTESIILLLIASLFLTMLLSSTVVTAIAQPFIETKWSKLKNLFSHRYKQENISEKL
ncbi:acyltransferase family protein [Bacillus sp. B190/17]|uniref:Acyltransferase family protein n=1 Tax=Bacillus lumedeiriae TaxID=3058829 RepID=A0ABW8I5S0_9BACI